MPTMEKQRTGGRNSMGKRREAMSDMQVLPAEGGWQR